MTTTKPPNPIEALIKYFDGVIKDAREMLPNLNDDTVIITLTLAETRRLSRELKFYVPEAK